VLRDADDIGGMPVVVADLHSALPAVLAGIFATERPRGAGFGGVAGGGAPPPGGGVVGGGGGGPPPPAWCT
jgi:hypothetical protein